MAAQAQPGVPWRRLNPFAFPSDTDFRFVLLIVSVLGSSIFIYTNIYLFFDGNIKRLFIDGLCNQLSGNASCLTSDIQINAVWVILCLLLLLSVAWLLYWINPAVKIWREGLISLPNDAYTQEKLAFLAELCQEAGLARMPFFLIKPLELTAVGVTFGRFGRYYVRLNEGLVAQFRTDQAAFRATVLHELGHIRNGDVDKAYFTLAITRAFTSVALLPMGASILNGLLLNFELNAPISLNIALHLLCFVLIITLTRNAILRSREVYADVRASLWDGPAGALLRTIASLSSSTGWWQRLRHTHPDPAERQRLVRDPARLLQQSSWDVFVAGLIVTSFLSNVSVTLLTPILIAAQTNVVIESDIFGTLFAGLVIGIVGLGIWRSTFARQAQGNIPLRPFRTGLALTGGLLLGQALSLTVSQTGRGYFTSIGGDYTTVDWGQAIIFITQLKTASQQAAPVFQTTLFAFSGSLTLMSFLMDLLLFIILCLFLRWIVTSAGLWLEIAAKETSPRRTYWIGFVVASIILGVCFGQISQALQLAQVISGFPNLLRAVPDLLSLNPIANAPTSLIFLLSQDPFVCLAFVLLWAYPLVSLFWQKRAALLTSSNWAYLDTPPHMQQALLRPQPFSSLLLALLLGLIGGLLFCSLQFFLVPLPSRNLYATDAVLLQCGIAAIVAGTVRRLSAFHALFSAFIAGCVITLGIGIYLKTGVNAQVSANSTWSIPVIFLQLVNEGALLALPIVLVVSTLSEKVRRSLKLDPARQAA